MEPELSELLRRVGSGDAAAREELMPLVYQELRHLAASRLRGERPGHTLQPTALVHEVYLRMFASAGKPALADKAHLLAVASQMMRRILVDYARARAADKRGGPMQRVDAETALRSMPGPEWRPADMLALDEALEALASETPHQARAFELHHFGGLTADEIATATGRSVHAVRHDLRFAQAWLRRHLSGGREER